MLASPELRATIHPDRGGDIASLVHLPAGIELLWQAPWPERQGPIPSDAQFDAWYAGGWQDLLPNGNEACVVDGVRHAFHGETWRREWQARRDGDAVELSLALETLALSVVRRIQVDGPSLVVAERVRNEGEAPVRCMWGQHPALGGGLLEPGCRIEVAGGTTLGYHELLEPRSRLGMGWRDRWPKGRTGAGDLLDLRDVPGPDARVHDVVLLTDLDEGRVAVVNPRLRLRFELVFPAEVFRWLWIWQAYGAALPPHEEPVYALAVEPWTSPPCLARAVEAGQAAELGPGQDLAVRIEARVTAL